MDSRFRKIAEELRSRFGDRLRQVLFFGSRARCEASPESDYDCLLVFNQVTPEIKRQLDHLSTQWLLEQGIVFAWVAVSGADSRFRYEPFLQNARREWIAA